MFIRRTATRSKLNGESYFTYRLVSSVFPVSMQEMVFCPC